jgi:hypothetical protein
MAGVFKALYCLFFRPLEQLSATEEASPANAAVNGVRKCRLASS